MTDFLPETISETAARLDLGLQEARDFLESEVDMAPPSRDGLWAPSEEDMTRLFREKQGCDHYERFKVALDLRYYWPDRFGRERVREAWLQAKRDAQ